MMIYALAALSLSTEYSICFYKTNSSGCPPETEIHKSYNLSSFDQYSSAALDNVTKIVYHIQDDMVSANGSPLVLNFSRFASNVPDVEIFATEPHKKVFIDMDSSALTKYVASIFLSNIEFHGVTSQTTLASISVASLTMFDTVFIPDNLPICASSVITDFSSFSSVASINSTTISLDAGAEYTSISKLLRLNGQNITFYGFAGNSTVLLEYGSIRFAKGSASALFDVSSIPSVSLVHSGKSCKLSVVSIMAGGRFSCPTLAFTLSNSAILAFEDALWSGVQPISIKRPGPSTIIVGSSNVPLDIIASSSSLLVVAASPNSSISGTLSIVGSEVVISGYPITISTLSSTSYSASISSSSSIVSLGSILASGNLSLIGSGFYSLGSIPTNLSTMIVENLKVNDGMPISLPFTLSSHVFLNVTSNISSNSAKNTICLSYAESQTHTDSEISPYFGVKTPIFSADSSYIGSFSIGFASGNSVRGFNKGTEIYSNYSDIYGSKTTIGIEISKNVSQVANKFCISTSSSDACPSDSANISSLSDWKSYANERNSVFSFDIFASQTGTIDLTDFSSSDKVLSVISHIGTIPINFSQSTFSDTRLKSISLTSIQVCVDNAANWNGFIQQSFTLSNTTWNSDIFGKVNFNSSITLSVDSSSLINLPNFNCGKLTIREMNYQFVNVASNFVTLAQNSSLASGLKIARYGIQPSLEFGISGSKFEIFCESGTISVPEITLSGDSLTNATFSGSWPSQYEGPQCKFSGSAYVNGNNTTIGFLSPITLSSSESSLNFGHPLSLNSAISVGAEPSIISFNEVSFGSSFSISSASAVSIKANNASFIGGTLKTPLSNFTCSGSIFVAAGSNVKLSSFDFLSESSSTIKMKFAMNNLPYASLNSGFKLKRPKEVILSYDGSDSKMINSYRNIYSSHEAPVICGNNISCSDWSISFENGGIAESTFESSCKSDDFGLQCLYLKVRTTPTPSPSPSPSVSPSSSVSPSATSQGTAAKSGLSKTQIFLISGGSLLIVAVAVVAAIFIVKKKKNRVEFSSSTLANPLV